MPAPFLSILIDDCIANGCDYNAGGARYNTTYIMPVGIGTVTDSLSAIKTHVFDRHTVLMRDLRGFILARLGLAADRPARRMYISRSGTSRRRIANEADVMDVFGQFDFEVVRFEHLSFDEQVRIATQCSVLAGNHGAGLVNMLFMPVGASVLELRRTGDRYSNCFFNLASTSGLRYYYQTCDPVLPDSDPHFGDIVVDTDQLRRTLTMMGD